MEEQYDKFDLTMFDMVEYLPIIYISIQGLSGSGKTNLAYLFYEKYFPNFNLLHYESYFNENKELIFDSILDEIKSTKRPYVIFDDLSFIVRVYQKEITYFLSELMRIRHAIKKGAFVFISHYRKSVLPVLREAHIFAITSLFQNQLQDYSKIFTYDSMYNFINKIRNLREHYALVWILGDIYTIKLPLSYTYLEKFGRGDYSG